MSALTVNLAQEKLAARLVPCTVVRKVENQVLASIIKGSFPLR